MTDNNLPEEPQKGIEPLTARLSNSAFVGASLGENANTAHVLRATTPERASKTLQAERTESERPSSGGIAGSPRLKSTGPERVGYITEAALAARWGRAPNTLVGWRTRPLPDRNRLRYDVMGGAVYFDWLDVLAFERDPANAWVRPLEARGTPLPDPDWHHLTIVQRVNLRAKRTPATPSEDGLAFLRTPPAVPFSEKVVPAIAPELVVSGTMERVEITSEGRRILTEMQREATDNVARGMLDAVRDTVLDPRSTTRVFIAAPRQLKTMEVVRTAEGGAGVAIATADDGSFWVAPAAALLQSPIPWRRIDPVITEAAA